MACNKSLTVLVEHTQMRCLADPHTLCISYIERFHCSPPSMYGRPINTILQPTVTIQTAGRDFSYGTFNYSPGVQHELLCALLVC
jgi:hypothetical protein